MKTYPTNQILKNKIAIITGAGSGIGKCMVERFVQEGAQCLAADLNQDSLNALVEDLGDFAGMVRTLQVDVSDRSQVENMVEEAVKQFGGLDILVNNAGNHCKKYIWDMSVEEYKSVLDVHLTGAFALTKAVVPYMKEKRHGRIIFQASMTSYIGQPMVAGYASAKAGYLGLIHTPVSYTHLTLPTNSRV